MNTSRNNINLKDLLEFLGKDLVRHGKKSFKLREHDSLIITDNKFYWNSRSVGGNYFTLLKELYGLSNKNIWNITQDFLDAVEYGDFVPGKIENKGIKEYKHYEKKNTLDNIKEYLCNKRCIDSKIVDSLYHNKLLYMDNRNNIVFVIKDKEGSKVGEEIIGTSVTKFRQNTSISNGFNLTRRNIKENPEIKSLYVFEGTIDMLSYIQMFKKEINDKWKDENVRFLTLSGLRDDIFEKYIDNIENVYVCTDNDLPGEKFYEKLKEKYENINFYREKSVEKDWNEDLVNNELWEKRDRNIEDMNIEI
ncbi:DUF3991 and toprim domain-containing protein [Streptobacillus moniliformis]|uniref:DUF3991 and toprim domain-containing protein n=1 Tax=Streptobacillus moniliformis TaxID=34105 RepID=UPI0007E4BE96|nr:DUF3991 and toprim domain-containing protein [Streptobacillus moniliformis]